MDFELNDEQVLLKDSVERFVQDNYELTHREALVATDLGFSRDNWNTFAEMGWLGLPFSEEAGGFDGTPVDVAAIMEAMGAGLVLEPYLSTVLLGGRLIEKAGSDEQKNELLTSIIGGETLVAFAYAESQSRFNLADVATTAEKSDGGYVINGRKSVVLNAASADKIIVSCRTAGEARDEAGISLLIVDADAPGLTSQDFRTLDGGRASDLTFDNVSVDADALLGEEGGAYPVIEEVIDLAISAVCAEAVGAMRKTNEITKEYAGTRKQFGAPIGTNQVIQHRLVDMHIAAEESKSMSDMGAMRISGDANERRIVASAIKSKIGEAGQFIGEQGIQLHGGIGMTNEYVIGHYYKRLQVINMLFGNVEHHVKRFTDLS